MTFEDLFGSLICYHIQHPFSDISTRPNDGTSLCIKLCLQLEGQVTSGILWLQHHGLTRSHLASKSFQNNTKEHNHVVTQ